MELATLGQRLRGAVVDGLVALVPYVLLRESGDNALIKLVGVLGVLGLFGLQAWLLARDGQSIGKKLVGTRIVLAADGGNGGFVTNVLLRAIVASIPNAIPFYYLVDTCFIFREDRRTLHDLIAKTKVVKA